LRTSFLIERVTLWILRVDGSALKRELLALTPGQEKILECLAVVVLGRFDGALKYC